MWITDLEARRGSVCVTDDQKKGWETPLWCQSCKICLCTLKRGRESETMVTLFLFNDVTRSQKQFQLLAIILNKIHKDANLRGEGADQEIGLGQEVDVQDDPSQRVLGVAVVKTGWPRDGVVTDELVFWIPNREREKKCVSIKGLFVVNCTCSDSNWLILGFLQQGGIVGGEVNAFLVHVDTPGEQLELLVHMEHVLFDRMEGCFRPHLICPPHMDPTDRQTDRQMLLQTVALYMYSHLPLEHNNKKEKSPVIIFFCKAKQVKRRWCSSRLKLLQCWAGPFFPGFF